MFNVQFIFAFLYEPILLMEKSIQSHIVEWRFAQFDSQIMPNETLFELNTKWKMK